MLGTRTSPSAQRAAAGSGVSKEMSLQLKFALRAQCGRGRSRSQQHVAHFRCRRLFGQSPAGALQKQKLIRYSRGTLILKPRHLTAIACKCYRTIKREYDNTLP